MAHFIPIARVASTLAAGALGGLAAAWLGIPLPFIVGSLVTVGTLAISGTRVAGHGILVPRWLRTTMIPIIGVMLGASFTPDVVQRMGQWWITMLALVVFITLSTGVVYQMYRRVFGFDPVTAYFSAVPGGLIEMSLIGDSAGGRAATISLIHFCRIVLSALSIPFLVSWLHGPVGDTAAAMIVGDKSPLTAADAAILISCGVVGFFGARRTGLPGAPVVGPLTVSALAHATGLTAASPPGAMIVVAQIVVGAALGAGFAGLSVRDLARGLRAAASASVIMLTVTIALAAAMHGLVGEPVGALILAYAPGGVTEMSLIALSAGISVAFVAAHHVARIFLSVLLMPWIFRVTVGPQPPRPGRGKS